MRAKRKEITDPHDLDAILDQALVLRLAMCRDNRPYVVPLCFALERAGEARKLVIHSARQGLKIEMLRANPHVSFEASTRVELRTSPDKACDFGMRYRSVVGFGRAEVVEDEAAVRRGLDLLMAKYAPAPEAARQWDYRSKSLALTALVVVTVGSMTGKQDVKE